MAADFLERGNTVVGVATILQPVDFPLSDLADERIGHVIVFADAEIEQFPLGMGGQHRTLGPFDFLELINLGSFAIIDPADAFSEEILKPWILQRCVHGAVDLGKGIDARQSVVITLRVMFGRRQNASQAHEDGWPLRDGSPRRIVPLCMRDRSVF